MTEGVMMTTPTDDPGVTGGRCQSACQLVLSVGVLIVAMFALLMWNGYDAATHAARSQAVNIANTLAEKFGDDLSRAESDLGEFAAQIALLAPKGAIGAKNREDLIAHMSAHLNEFRIVRDFRVYDAQGREVLGALTKTGEAEDASSDVSEQNWFLDLKKDPARHLGLSHVQNGPGQSTKTIVMGTPIWGNDGIFQGAVAALIDLGVLQREIDALALGENDLILVRRTDDYRLILRRPVVEDRLNTAPVTGKMKELIQSGQAMGVGDAQSPYDGRIRTYAFCTMGRFPFFVAALLDKDDYLMPWRQQMAISAGVTLVLTLAMLVLFRRYHIEQDRLTRHALRYRAVMSTGTDGIHILDANGDLVEASASFYRALGYDPDNPPVLNVADWDAVFCRDEILDRLKSLMTGGRSVFETRHRRVDNSVIDVEITATPIVLGTRNLLYNSSRDITARKRFEQELQATALRLNRVLDAVDEGVIGIDDDRRVMFANPSALRMLGYKTLKDALGRRMGDAVGHRRADHVPCVPDHCPFSRALETMETVRGAGEYFTRSDGGCLDVEYAVLPLISAGASMGAIVAFHDVTERKALEADLRRSNADLEQFAYVASHDLRQPLRMISSYLELLEKRIEGTLDAETRRFLEFATAGARKMDAMIINLLELSRIGRNARPFVSVPLETVVFDAVESLRVALDESGGTVIKSAKLPSVHGDADQLLRLFQNLIDNAIKYRSPNRKVEIDIGAREENGGWVVWVRDNGTGILPEFHERVFVIYQRLVQSSQVEGTGIGLAICQKIVQHHGGKIWIESDGENGTAFLIFFLAS